ncbi:MAG: hypothetical protein IT438_01285 [Phycisphaerales bacterium]|nr:hypothetical protein [Phycisphaerales bacterium]
MKPLKLATETRAAEPKGGGAAARREPDRIEAWLDTLSAMLRAPEREKAEIREELESHLRERMRDLTLEGVEEQQAALRAIDELGEVARLAERFRRARTPSNRRLTMNIAILSLAGAAAVASSVSLLSGNPPRAETRSPEEMRLAQALESEKAKSEAVTEFLTYALKAEPAGEAAVDLAFSTLHELLSRTVATRAAAGGQPGSGEEPVAVDFNQTPLEEVLATFEKAVGHPAFIHWKDLEERGIERGTQVTLKAPAARHDVIRRLLNESLGLSGSNRLAARVDGEMVEIATQGYWDRLDSAMEVFDLGDVAMDEDARTQIVQLVMSTVEPDGWRENGGDVGSIHIVGSKVFVKTAKRLMPEVRWIMDRLMDKPAAEPGAAAPAGRGEWLGAGGGDGAGGGGQTRRFRLSHIEANSARELLGQICNVSPALKQCDVIRVWEVDGQTNTLIVTATADQLRVIGRLIEEIDRGSGEVAVAQLVCHRLRRLG